MEDFVQAAKVGELAPGEMKLVEAEDEMILLINVDGDLYAISDTCTHQECSLSEGELEGDMLECSCHGSQFIVRTGAVESGPALEPVPTYAVRIDGDNVLIGPM